MAREYGETDVDSALLVEGGEPSAPDDGAVLFVDSDDGELKAKDSAGEITSLTGGS